MLRSLCTAHQGDTMSRFTDTLMAPAAPGRAGPATRQGRKHVGGLRPAGRGAPASRARRGRIHQHASAHRAGYRDALSLTRRGRQVGHRSRRLGSARELAADGASLVELQQAGGWEVAHHPGRLREA